MRWINKTTYITRKDLFPPSSEMFLSTTDSSMSSWLYCNQVLSEINDSDGRSEHILMTTLWKFCFQSVLIMDTHFGFVPTDVFPHYFVPLTIWSSTRLFLWQFPALFYLWWNNKQNSAFMLLHLILDNPLIICVCPELIFPSVVSRLLSKGGGHWCELVSCSHLAPAGCWE